MKLGIAICADASASMPALLNVWLWIGVILVTLTILATYRLSGRRSR